MGLDRRSLVFVVACCRRPCKPYSHVALQYGIAGDRHGGPDQSNSEPRFLKVQACSGLLAWRIGFKVWSF